MDKKLLIQPISLEKLGSGRFNRLHSFKFLQNGKERNWEITFKHNVIGCLIYNRDRDEIVLVRQFRPGVYLRRNTDFTKQLKKQFNPVNFPPATDGMMVELCMGYVDKGETMPEAAVRELKEETGFEVPMESLQCISHNLSADGHKTGLYYAEVGDSDKKHPGGGLVEEGEQIELFHLPAQDVEKFVNDQQNLKPTSLLLALTWFLLRQVKNQ